MNQPLNSSTDLLNLSRADSIHGSMTMAQARRSHEAPSEYVEYWRAIMMRKWSILLFALLVGIVTTFVVFQIAPRYRSTATVLIETSKAKVVQVEDVYSGISANREYFQTQAEVLKSREVAQRVVRALNLAKNPEFDPRQRKPSGIEAWVAENVPLAAELLPQPPPAGNEAAVEAAVLRKFATRLSVEPVRLSQLVKVNFESTDPTLAAAVANGVVDAYIQSDIEARMKMTSTAGSWINERLGELKTKLDASEKALQTYREREGMLDSKSMVLGGNGRQLEELTQRLVEARVRRSEAEEAYNQVKSGELTNYASVPAVVRSISVQRALEVEAEAEKRLAEVSQRYGPDHPKHVAAESELKTARANTKKQAQTIVASIQKEYNAAKATEKTIEEALGQSKGQIQHINRKEIQLGVLEREANANRQLYQTFLSRFKETNATGDAQQANARLVDQAVATFNPVWPMRYQTIAIVTILGALAGVAMALVLRALNNTVKNSEDVELRLGQPFLAALPKLTGKSKSNPAAELFDNPLGLYAESIRTASTGVLLSALDVPRKVVLVTSSVPGEGKSTFSLNFAFSQSKTKRVLLIEADMRRPSIGKVLNVENSQKGLSECIAGNVMIEDALIKINDTSLHVLVAGYIPPNPLELLVASRFRELIKAMHQSYDMIVIDSPPIQLVSDALVIASCCTGAIYVVKADETPLPLAKAGIMRMTVANVPLFGVVLNQQDFKRAEKYYGEYSAYARYGYSDGYLKKPA